MSMAQFLQGRSAVPQTVPMKFQGQSIKYYVRRKKDYVRKDGTSAIYLDCFINGQRARIPIENLSATAKQWDENAGRFKGRSQIALDNNLIIDEYRSRVYEIALEVRLGKLKVTKESFIDQILNFATRTDFLAYYLWRLNQRKSELAHGTWRQHKSVYNILKAWRATLPFGDISEKLFYDFRKHLERKGNNVNTIGSKLKAIKVYLNLALRDGYKFKMPEKSLKRLQTKSKVSALTERQIKAAVELFKTQYLPDHLNQTLRCFLFSCFTGLRFSDVQELSPANFVNNYLIITPQKTKSTGKMVKIPLSTPALALVDKNCPKPLGHVISNVKTNTNLKVIAKFIGFQGNLTFHASRHTFATLFLELGGQVEVLQTLLGHSKIEQTMIYTHVVDKRREAQISNFDKLL